MNVLVCKSNKEITGIKNAYKAIYEKELEKEFQNMGGGEDTKRLFVSIIQGARKDGQVTAEDVASFPENILTYFCTKSEAFLRELFRNYNGNL